MVFILIGNIWGNPSDHTYHTGITEGYRKRWLVEIRVGNCQGGNNLWKRWVFPSDQWTG